MATTTSLLHTALQNLHVAQQVAHPSHTPRPPSSVGSTPASPRLRPTGSSLGDEEEDENEIVRVGRGTAPGTPIPGKGMVLGQRIRNLESKDPLRLLPTHIAVRIFLQLDISTLARCDRVCKKWQKSSTLNYVWFLQNRALTLPMLAALPQGKARTLDDGSEFFDPYDKTPRLSALPAVPVPKSNAPQWTKAESKRAWKSVFHTTLARTDPSHDEDDHPYRVTIDSLQSSGYSTPARHSHAGTGAGNASRWAETAGTGSLTPTERKLAAREGYKALGGRKSRAKRKMGGEYGQRDKTGAGGLEDDPRFSCPW